MKLYKGRRRHHHTSYYQEKGERGPFYSSLRFLLPVHPCYSFPPLGGSSGGHSRHMPRELPSSRPRRGGAGGGVECRRAGGGGWGHMGHGGTATGAADGARGGGLTMARRCWTWARCWSSCSCRTCSGWRTWSSTTGWWRLAGRRTCRRPAARSRGCGRGSRSSCESR